MLEIDTQYWDGFASNLRDPPSSRMLSTQLLIAISIGLFAIFLFAILRNRYPHIFMARLSYLKKINNSKIASNTNNTNNNNNNANNTTSTNNKVFTKSFLNISDKSFFNSIFTLHKITDEEIIDFAGLDAYVFLGFFKMSIRLLFVCWIFAVLIISPIRYRFTGNYDQDNNNKNPINNDGNYWFNTYLSIYVIFTYLFTYITCYFLIKQAKTIIKKRQEILGKQNSITDRTIRLSGIPPELRSEKILKDILENLNIGKVEKIVICKEWKKLDYLFNKREKIIKKLEFYWANYSIIQDNKNFGNLFNNNIRLSETNTDQDNEYITAIYQNKNQSNDQLTVNSIFNDNGLIENGSMSMSDSNLTLESHASIMSTVSIKSRPFFYNGLWGIFGEKIDALDYYSNQLNIIDEEIKNARNYHYPATPTAFVTMDSVATAQTLAQAVLDPRIGYLITNTAPAPADIIWENATLPSHSRKLKIYYITVITGILGVIFILPVGYLATLLNFKSIKKFWPSLAEFLLDHEWASKIIIDLLPVYLYTILNGLIPFLYVWLSSKQGFISYGEEELSVVSKNFFYIFVNLFLVFTMAGTASNYWGYLSDSKKLALQLAQSLRGLSYFYIDTIILQGIGLMPFKLLPIGRIFQFIYFWSFHSKNSEFKFPFLSTRPTARDLTLLYQPPDFNFGLQLPLPLLTLIITLIYSVISTKILSAGLIYFIIGYYVYKFLLIYTYVHPQHSTGKVMPIIFRRIILGLLLFQLTVAGTLALEKSWILAMCLAPLPLATLMVLWHFQEKLKPLSIFIALRAIDVEKNELKYKDAFSTTTSSTLNNYSDTISNLKKISKTKTLTSSINDSNIWEENVFNNLNSDLNNVTPNNNNSNEFGSSVITENLKTTATIDERREQNQSYDYPHLVGQLEGPWIGLENADISGSTNNSNYNNNTQNNDIWILVWTSDGIVRKRINNETNQMNL